MGTYDVVMKLVGFVEPVGDSHTDEQTYVNLKELCDLTGKLLNQIYDVSYYKTDHRNSVKRSGEYAANFLAEVAQMGD